VGAERRTKQLERSVTGQLVLASTSSKELEDFVGAKFYCQHAVADANQCIWIREKTLEFTSTVLSVYVPDN